MTCTGPTLIKATTLEGDRVKGLSVVIFLLLLSFNVLSDEQLFTQCIKGLQQEARQQNLPDPIITDVLGQLKYQQRVVKLDRSQPEFTQTFADYFYKRVTRSRISKAQKLYIENRDFLDELTQQYGIPGQYLVAFWGLETNFGSYLGKMPILDALATLACDPRRSNYFTGELMAALRIVDRENLNTAMMKGSWAGAMGHTQFMPTTYERYAVDGNGDGKINLWQSRKDALASAANFLNQLGWKTTERWGREVLLPSNFDYSNTGLGNRLSLSQWRQMGVKRIDGVSLPLLDIEASILVPMGHNGAAFIVYDNYRVIMRWNFSESYALAVGHLADRAVGGVGLSKSLKVQAPALNPSLIANMQQKLTTLGFDTKGTDGIIGSATRSALRDFQASESLIADGFPHFSTFEALGISTQ